MMSERCAICHEDNRLTWLCDRHGTLRVKRQQVGDGTLSDWPHVQHDLVMTSRAIADDRAQVYDAMDASMGGVGLAQHVRLWAEMGTVLECVDVRMEPTGRESFGDGLAVYGLIDWRRINDEHGKAAA